MTMSSRKLVIAIDGPAASGKSTTAQKVAKRLGYTYIDTGAMYRAVTLATIEAGIDPSDQEMVEELAGRLTIEFQQNPGDGSLCTILDDRDVSREIRSPEVTAAVSLVSSYPGVRRRLVDLQKSMGRRGGVVLDGRDIGTVVFPDADLKIFMVADLQARAERRHAELRRRGTDLALDDLVTELAERDRFDSSRDLSPMKKAADAVEIDTSGLSIDDQVELVLGLAEERMKDG
jgi:cytidylate kinase